MNICVFKRYELKYLLTKKQYVNVLNAASEHLIADSHGESTIQSLYYDTDDFRLIRRSMEKPDYKEKLRLRSYGLADKNDTVFFELKKKYSGAVYKRRIELTYKDVDKDLPKDSQIAREIDYFLRFYRNLSPKMLLLYDRTAYFGEGDLRITFDNNIRYRNDRLTLSSGLDGISVLPADKVLMEIKTGTAIPIWLVKILSNERVVKTSFSKYGEAYRREYTLSNAEVKKVG
ncbi:MAG: polyphosphate polymerase domain-containing protein [Christensenellales bacterium]